MRTLDSKTDLMQRTSGVAVRAKISTALVLGLLFTLVLAGAGCKKETATEAIETDANGYLCTNCGAKFYTSRNEFLGSKCPKCGQYSLVEVVGYMCEKDHHITIRPRVSGPEGAAICEICGAHLTNAMVLPHEKDLIAWGATKIEGQPAP